ncbi:hypothetical protein BDFG_02509 [Blastomyces dermatitidis ATCC 26199]|nr:hypothetical protein BDFG_02509 [Blastomyces dermatitidis ATCC 26199]
MPIFIHVGPKSNDPEVYRYFTRSNIGYLVMEFIDGISFENIMPQENPEVIQNLAEAIIRFRYESSTRLPRASDSRDTSRVPVF